MSNDTESFSSVLLTALLLSADGKQIDFVSELLCKPGSEDLVKSSFHHKYQQWGLQAILNSARGSWRKKTSFTTDFAENMTEAHTAFLENASRMWNSSTGFKAGKHVLVPLVALVRVGGDKSVEEALRF